MSFVPTPPPDGQPITMTAEGLQVPDVPIIPFIEGDGTGPDIWRAAVQVLDAAVEKAYGRARRLAWMEVLAGEKAFHTVGSWLPDETVEAFQKYLVGLKGPLTTPVGGGIRSLNVTLRQTLDLYVCLRPVRYFEGVPSPVKHPEKVDMVIFRENTEDIYAGIEWAAGTEEAQKVIAWLQNEMGVHQIRFPKTSAIGIKPISEEGSKRLVRAAIQYAQRNDRKSVTLVHKGNIMKFTEGGFRDWGYQLAREEFGAEPLNGGPWQVIPAAPTEREDGEGRRERGRWRGEKGEGGGETGRSSGEKGGSEIIIKDAIADIFLQQVLTRPEEFDVVATMNLNGDYISDALAAQVGGIGIAPGGNINYDRGHALFEATHGTAPKYAHQDVVNPGSVILSGEMMLRYLGWTEAAERIIQGLEGAIGQKTVTYDFHRLMEGATKVSTSEFGNQVIARME